MASEADDRPRSGVWAVVAVILLLPALYVLSLGPVALLCQRFGGLETLGVIYAPLIWLHEHTPLRGPLEWYVKAWRVR